MLQNKKVTLSPIEAKDVNEIVEIAFQALDSEGIKMHQKLLVSLQLIEIPTSENEEPEKELFAWAHGKKDSDGSVLMDNGATLSAGFIPKLNEEITEVKLLADEGLSLQEENTLKIKAVRSGLYKNVRFEIKTNNSSFTSPSLNILVGKKDIAINLNANNQGYVVKNAHNMEGIVLAQDEINEVKYIIFQEKKK